MVRYRLTKRGKLVVALLCSFIVLFFILEASKILNEPLRDARADYKPIPKKQTPIKQLKPKMESLKKLNLKVYFDADASFVNKKYYTQLDTFIATALQYKDTNIQIEGNCATQFENYKSEEHKSVNYNLSLLRAQAIANYLKAKGVNSDRLVIVANGSDKPTKDNSTPEGRKMNRRVDIFFTDR